MTDLILEILRNGWDIQIYCQAKRIDGRFVGRFVWKAQKRDNINDIEKECEWKGFEKEIDCIGDMYNKLIIKTKK